MHELVFLTGARAGQLVTVNRTMIAGRSPECQIEAPDPNASRQHCKFIFDGQSVMIADNNSSNGTYLNEVRLAAPVRLEIDDVVRLGETRLRYQLQGGDDDSGASSSIFDFREQDEDLSQSIVLSVADLAQRNQSPEVLAQRLAAIIKVSHTLVNIDKIDEIFAGILETLFEVFPQTDRGFLMTGHDVNLLEPRAIRSRDGGMTENLSVSTSICRHALSTKAAILFDSSKGGDFDQGMSIVSLKIRSAMVVPLLVGEEVLGLLQLDTPDRHRAFAKPDLELALAVSQQAAIALNNALLLKKVSQEATTRNNLMRFLPGPVVQQVIDGQLDIAVGGRTCTGSILFSDIIGFTALSETLDPALLITLMNAYFKRVVPCIQRNGGSVDKFMGDAIMAVWGVPIDKGDSALQATQAALMMQNVLIGFNSLQQHEGGPQLAHGIGVNTGPVTAGNIGYEQRIEYTVLGDTVNTAQRMEATAGRSQVLISTGTWEALQGKAYGIALPPVRVKNKAELLPTFAVRGLRLDDEIVLHLPCRSGGKTVFLIRRLVDGSFILLYPEPCELLTAPLLTDAPEWPGIPLGVPVMESVLPSQDSDGHLVRAQVRLSDETLAGLLGERALPCALVWEQMGRSAVAAK